MFIFVRLWLIFPMKLGISFDGQNIAEELIAIQTLKRPGNFHVCSFGTQTTFNALLNSTLCLVSYNELGNDHFSLF